MTAEHDADLTTAIRELAEARDLVDDKLARFYAAVGAVRTNGGRSYQEIADDFGITKSLVAHALRMSRLTHERTDL